MRMEPEIKIPQRLRKRPRFAGYVIPYTTWIHPVTHEPDFKINDEYRRVYCILRKACAMCGQRMNKLICFIGGEGLLTGLLAVDAGMHPECGKYAWQVCPYIIYGKGHATHRKEHEGAVISEFRDVPKDPPKAMYMITTDTFTPLRWENNLFAKPGKPLSVETRTYGAAT